MRCPSLGSRISICTISSETPNRPTPLHSTGVQNTKLPSPVSPQRFSFHGPRQHMPRSDGWNPLVEMRDCSRYLLSATTIQRASGESRTKTAPPPPNRSPARISSIFSNCPPRTTSASPPWYSKRNQVEIRGDSLREPCYTAVTV